VAGKPDDASVGVWMLVVLARHGLFFVGRVKGRCGDVLSMTNGCSARHIDESSDTVIGVSEFRLFHNPRCSKSRAALEIVEAHQSRGRDIEIVRYLDNPPDADTIRMLIATLDGSPGDLVRRDPALAETGVDVEQLSNPDAVVKVLLAAPELLQRPLLSDGSRTVIGRPTENISELLDG